MIKLCQKNNQFSAKFIYAMNMKIKTLLDYE